VQRDVTYEVGLEQTLRYSQEFDQLTGLPNRDATRAFVAAALARARHDGTSVALAVGDVAGFRDLNHNYGYAAGDVMLEELAFRVRGVVRGADLCGRIAADEFALVLTGLPGNYDEASSVANAAIRRVADVLHEPIEISAGLGWTPTISFGLAISPFDARESESLLVAAESRRGVVTTTTDAQPVVATRPAEY
jgi:diguanylate cyclase (GGDEF)-like protein